MRKIYVATLALLFLASCRPNDFEYIAEDASTFAEISSYDVGEVGAAEITAYDPLTKKLFIVTNNGGTGRIDILNISDPSAPAPLGFIDVSPYGGGVNSVSVHDGKVAAAIEGFAKTDAGKVVVFKTTDYSVVQQVIVGALPDMITYTYDGKYILTANEGEPNDSYTIDPPGTVSIISTNNYHVVNLDFSAFASQQASLQSRGFRIFGPNASFAQDIEPEYLTISHDSKTAWVTLQENNGIAKIDIRSRRITDIFPLGFKDYNVVQNAIDPSDRDGGIMLNTWPVKGMFQPDGIAVVEQFGIPYLFTANEGDVREWTAYAENKRVKDLVLDPTAFPDATIRTDAKLGRLNVTNTLGDAGNDGDYEALFSFGARSFTVWNGWNGNRIFDSGNDLEEKTIAAGKYDDLRSDDKGVEPEGLTLGLVGRKKIAFVGMERSDVVAVYDVSDPRSPVFIKILLSGDAPEGLTFIPAQLSPIGKSLLVVSSENDGVVKIFRTN